MKDHEIVLRRDRRLAEMERAVNGLSEINTNNIKRENMGLGLFHTLAHLHPETNSERSSLCHQKRQ